MIASKLYELFSAVTDKTIGAVVAYCVDVRSSRICFWEKSVVGTAADVVNGVVSLSFMAAARVHFGGMPEAKQFVAILTLYLVAVLMVAFVASIVIRPARDMYIVNMRKFLSVAWIASSFGATFVCFNYLLDWIPLTSDWIDTGWRNWDPDLIATSTVAAIVGVSIVALHSLTVTTDEASSTWLQKFSAFISLVVAVTCGFLVLFGFDR